MADIRRILKEHVADVVPADGVVHCRGDELTFDSMEAFGRHVDALLSRPPRSQEEAVARCAGHPSGRTGPVARGVVRRHGRRRRPHPVRLRLDRHHRGGCGRMAGRTWPTPFSKRWGGSDERRGRVRRRRRSARPVRGPGALRARPRLPRRGRLVPRPGRRGHDGGRTRSRLSPTTATSPPMPCPFSAIMWASNDTWSTAASPAGAARPAGTHETDATGNKPHGFGKRSRK